MEENSNNSQYFRNSNIELLRIFLMFGIVLWHIVVHGLNYADIGNNHHTHIIESTFILSFMVPCVNVFVLLSGFFTIKLNSIKLLHFELMALFYSIILGGIYLITSAEFHTSILLRSIFPISSKVWWFFTSYFLLMLISPLLNLGLKNMSDKHLIFFIIIFEFINGVGTSINLEIFAGSNFQSFILLYAIGHLIKRKIELIEKYNIFIFITILFLIVSINFVVLWGLIGSNHNREFWVYLNYSNPIILFQSIILVLIFLKMKPFNSSLINKFSRNVFAVYLITDSILLQKKLNIFIVNIYESNGMFIAFSLICLAFIGCLLIESFRSYIMKPIEQFLLNCLLKIRTIYYTRLNLRQK